MPRAATATGETRSASSPAASATLLAGGAAAVGLRAHHSANVVMGAMVMAAPQAPVVVEPISEPAVPHDEINDAFAPTTPTSSPPPHLKMGKLVRAR